jgi:hypothetical protein
MQFKRSIFTAFFIVASPVFAASLVTYSGNPTTISGIKVYPTATVHTPGGDVALVLSGAGVGRKTKVFTFDAYVAASYVQDVAALRAAPSPLAGIQAQPVKVLAVNMLWNLNKEEIKGAFRDGLVKNKVDLSEAAVASIFSQFDAGMNKGQAATLVAYNESASLEALTIELPTKSISEKGKDLATKFFSIWFGEGDKNIKALQPLLVGKGN